MHSPPRRWSLDHNPLSGLTLGRWWRLLRDNRFDYDRIYAHRVAFITTLSAFNSLWAGIESLRFSGAVRRARVRPDPVFILGHWRSGTTHLHNLLSLDDRLAFPSTFAVVNPFSFLTTQRWLPRLMAPLLPETRPMDNMSMSFEGPQEDELALSLICGLSLYLSLSFPRQASRYDRYLTFEGVSADEIERWKQAFLWFAAKLSVGHDRPIVFKSPGHTARVKLLLELFPQARFVHIHRNPYEVFQSSRHYFHTAAWHANLQALDAGGFDEAILSRYVAVHEAYLSQRSLIPPGRLHELGFAALESDPIGELRRMYGALDLGEFAVVEGKVRAYLESLAGYRRNEHRPLAEEDRRIVAQRWGRFFEAFGYSPEMSS
jgi:hypothetical protein